MEPIQPDADSVRFDWTVARLSRIWSAVVVARVPSRPALIGAPDLSDLTGMQ
jgi:hypothetical protein